MHTTEIVRPVLLFAPILPTEVWMLIDLSPQAHSLFLKLPLLGDHLAGLAQHLTARGNLLSRIR